MCDDCETIFSDTTPGISSGSSVDPDTGRQVPLDFCPDCSRARKERRSSMVWRKTPSEPKAIEPNDVPRSDGQ